LRCRTVSAASAGIERRGTAAAATGAAAGAAAGTAAGATGATAGADTGASAGAAAGAAAKAVVAASCAAALAAGRRWWNSDSGTGISAPHDPVGGDGERDGGNNDGAERRKHLPDMRRTPRDAENAAAAAPREGPSVPAATDLTRVPRRAPAPAAAAAVAAGPAGPVAAAAAIAERPVARAGNAAGASAFARRRAIGRRGRRLLRRR